MKKILNLMFITLICFVLTGCFGAVIDVNLNSDGTGSISAQIGYTKMAYETLKSFAESGDNEESKNDLGSLKPFVYNGTTYYGETEKREFSSVEEFNLLINQNEKEIKSGLFNLRKESDNSFTLTLDITSQTANTTEAEMSIESFGMSEEEVELLMKDAIMQYTINMPSNIVQVEGDNFGITIKGKSLTIDFLKLNIPTEPNVTKTYRFTTKAMAQRFSDVPTSLWSYDAIENLAQGGLVSGVGEGRFSPERGMKISEFCQVLANANGLESGADSTGYWAAKAIKSCIDKGYIYSHGEINSKIYDEVITREEAISAIQLASGRQKIQGKNITLNDIPDANQISDKYKDLIIKAYNSGITTGVNEQLKFSPKNKLTRGQVCQLFYNVNWTTKKENIKQEDKSNNYKVKAELRTAEQIGKAVRIWLTDAIAEEAKIRENIIKDKFVQLNEINNSLDLYISLDYKPISLSKSEYYVTLEDSIVKIVVASSQEEANSLKNTTKEYDGINAGWAYIEGQPR